MKIAYLDAFSGISGDMTIAAFLDAGVGLSAISRGLKKLGIQGYELKVSRVRRGGIAGTKFDCLKTKGYRGHRSLKSIIALIDKSGLSARVKAVSKAVFNNIGRAEATVHGRRKAGDVFLHELGDIDSIVDIVGAALALDLLGIEAVYASVVNMGRTFVDTAHGRLPIPGPAALELMKGVPVKISDIDAELVTPTGAGILKTVSRGFGAMPQMKIANIGYGAGAREIEGSPNMLRVIIGETAPSYKEESVMVVEANIDDMNPQYFERASERLFACGALDVYTTAIQMKKSRPAFKLTAICRPADLKGVSSVIFSETTTIGLRFYEAGRYSLERRTVKARTKYGEIRVKVSSAPGGIFTASPEYNDCLRAARDSKAPIRVISDKAREIAYEKI